MAGVSVLILTKNEEINIERCIRSVSWSDDIVVFDSFSDDRTVELAEQLGARVIQRKFDNWSAHQNWGVENIKFKHPWVYYTDADETCDDQLRDELLALEKNGESFSAFQVRRKDYFMGRWLKRSQLYPTWITRVFRPEKIRYERLVNPVATVAGETGKLDGHIIHYPFSHGVGHWFDRHNKYSQMEAADLVTEVAEKINWADFFSRDAAVKRRALKTLAYKMPGRPVLMFMYLYFFRLGLLDGLPGLRYSIMRSMYEYMIDLKVVEYRYTESEGKGSTL
ncbi:glycosyltransferase family 2 protein [Pontiella agarivorans]|uniref:Glycosyltransferase family 2 protein n=1 Tax=Pontiella agarivorans TaxID=3038953 RepID=A0ABU5MU79_9BACT|nr:glycosyltransferase family 2 protein [Pontiella agarivorans]MDZ8117738.1 glycosyltransferase family 2 protein [Pontiella agarivorans]